jgi:hypothetical protein
MKKTKRINPNWTAYDKSVAKCHIANYGVIYLDCYGQPIDDEYLLEELYERSAADKK